MPGLLSALGTTANSLDAATEAIDITSNNISNLNNPNYAKETVQFNDRGMVETADGPVSLGQTVSVQQESDSLLNQMVMTELGNTAGFTSEQTLYQQAQAALGESITNSTASTSGSSTTTDSGLQAALDGFFNAVQDLATNPTGQPQKDALIQAAGVLTDRFQSISANLSEVQTGAVAQINQNVSTANGLLTQIATLNSQIGSLEVNSPGSAVDLRDEREGDLEQLAGIVPVTVVEGSNGEDTVSAAASGGGSVTLVSNGTVAGPLSYSAGVLSGGASNTALSISAGSIFGTLTASTGAVQTLQTNLDSLANQLVTAVNSAYNPSDTVGGNFFNAADTTAATIGLDSHLTEATLNAGTSPGDNSLALAVAAVANHSYSTGGGDSIDGTPDEFYANAVSNIGQALQTASTNVTDQTDVQTVVENQRNSVSGVSLNEEVSNLMTYQRAFQASSEVFNVVNTMLGDLMTNVG